MSRSRCAQDAGDGLIAWTMPAAPAPVRKKTSPAASCGISRSPVSVTRPVGIRVVALTGKVCCFSLPEGPAVERAFL